MINVAGFYTQLTIIDKKTKRCSNFSSQGPINLWIQFTEIKVKFDSKGKGQISVKKFHQLVNMILDEEIRQIY